MQAPTSLPAPATSQLSWASGITTGDSGVAGALGQAEARGQAAKVITIRLGGDQAIPPVGSAQWRGIDPASSQIAVSIPVTAGAPSVEDAAKGRNKGQWSSLADTLKALSPRPSVVTLTTPPEAAADPAHRAVAAAAKVLKDTAPGTLVAWQAPLGTNPNTATQPIPEVDVVLLDLATAPQWPALVNADGGLNAWSDYAAGHLRKRVAISWKIDKSTTVDTVQNIRAWLGLAASQQRLAYETVEITPDANAEALAAYRANW